MVLNQDFREFIELLNRYKVRYLIVGGYAVALHGYPRYTKDLDIWLPTDEDNVTKILSVLRDFGFESLKLNEEDFMVPGRVIQLGYPPNRIDLITSATGLKFGDCYDQKITVTVEGLTLNCIDLENLKKNKRETGRYQDLADLENLE